MMRRRRHFIAGLSLLILGFAVTPGAHISPSRRRSLTTRMCFRFCATGARAAIFPRVWRRCRSSRTRTRALGRVDSRRAPVRAYASMERRRGGKSLSQRAAVERSRDERVTHLGHWGHAARKPGEDAAARIQRSKLEARHAGSRDSNSAPIHTLPGQTRRQRRVRRAHRIHRTPLVAGGRSVAGSPAIVRSATVQIRTTPGADSARVSVEPMLAVWLPSDDPIAVDGPAGFEVPAGAELLVRVRYKKTWRHERKEMTDRSTVGLYFARDASAPVRAITLAPPAAVLVATTPGKPSFSQTI
jgi:hypothetical protein